MLDIKKIKQQSEITLNQLMLPYKDITALLGALSLPYLNNIFKNIPAIQSANKIYNDVLKMVDLNNTPILKYLSANGVLTATSYVLLLTMYKKSYLLDSKANDCKELKITDNGKTNGNTIIPIRERTSFKNRHIKQLICFSNGILPSDFEKDDNLERLSSKWGKYVIGAEKYKRDKLIISYAKNKSEKTLFWKNEFLSDKDFELVLGEDEFGDKVVVNLNNNPHYIIASTSGGGKTTLFKLMLMQAYLKGALIYIIDFKGGLDFNKGWKNLDRHRCEIKTNINEVDNLLSYFIMNEGERRKRILNEYHCKDLEEYNSKIDNNEITAEKLERIVIGIDEASQIFTSSRDKEKENILKTIRDNFDKISELFRAVGIHLIISTQVPSSQVLTEKIRHNCDYRICGRSNKILSEMVIDSPKASTIPKKSRGKFITNENKEFQSYLFYEKKVFKELAENKE